MSARIVSRCMVSAAFLALLCVALPARSRPAPSRASAAQSQPASQPSEGPPRWKPFLRWAETQINTLPPSLPLPDNPSLPAQQYAVIRLNDVFGGAQAKSDWKPSEGKPAGVVALGPFDRKTRRNPNFRPNRYVDPKSGASRQYIISGFDVNREEIGAIQIEIKLPYGKFFDLDWSVGGNIRVPVPDNAKVWTFTLATDDFVDWTGPLKQIGIRLDGEKPGFVEIPAIRFLRHENAYAEAAGARRANLSREARGAIYAHAPAEIRFPSIALPRGARFQSGVGRFAPSTEASTQAAPAPAEFELLVEVDGRTTSVLKKSIDQADRWVDISASLENYSGQTVALVLRSSSSLPGEVLLWGNPTIYEAVQNAPLLIVYLIDTLAAEHTSLYGYERPTTPRIEEFAKSGVWFANAFCNAPQTVTSIPNLMFSLSTEQHGVTQASIVAPAELVTIADTLRAAGWATVSFCTNVNAGPRQGMDQGFDTFFDRIAFWWTEGEVDRTVPIEESMAWLEANRDRPRFVYVHTAEPHSPYFPKEGYAGRFDTGYRGPLNGEQRGPTNFTNATTPDEIAHIISLYDEEVLYADARFGMFLDELARRGWKDSANIFLLADHGEEFQQHGAWMHGQDLHNEVHRIPMVAAGPAFSARGRKEQATQLLDIYPTILDLFGYPAPYQLRGDSLLPLLKSDAAETAVRRFDDRPLFASNYKYSSDNMVEFALVEGGRWKLMYKFTRMTDEGPKGQFELYDLSTDPRERNDVLTANREIGRRMVSKLIDFRRSQKLYDPGEKRTELQMDAEQIRELEALGYIGGHDDSQGVPTTQPAPGDAESEPEQP